MPKSSKNLYQFGNSTSYIFTTDDLTCNICNNKYVKREFSNIKINKLAKELKKYKGIGPRPKIICKNCTQQPRTHLTCFNCGIRKLLVEYSKSQRGNSETARCLDCMEQYYQESQGFFGNETSEICGPFVPSPVNKYIAFREDKPSNSDHSLGSAKSTTKLSSSTFIYDVSDSLTQELECSSNYISIPPYILDTYSIFQLIGRKNPPPPSQKYIILNYPETCEKSDPIYMNAKQDSNNTIISSSQFSTLPNILSNIKFHSIAPHRENSNVPIFSILIHDITVDCISLLDKYAFCRDYKDQMKINKKEDALSYDTYASNIIYSGSTVIDSFYWNRKR